MSFTYDHRLWRTGLPVRSAILKPQVGRLVVGWVTTSEYRLLYVFVFLPILSLKVRVEYCCVEGGYCAMLCWMASCWGFLQNF